METKTIFRSRTVWGVIVSLVGSLLLPHVGVTIDRNRTAAIVDHALIVIGAALTLYGRVKATKRVTLTGSSATATPVDPRSADST